MLTKLIRIKCVIDELLFKKARSCVNAEQTLARARDTRESLEERIRLYGAAADLFYLEKQYKKVQQCLDACKKLMLENVTLEVK